MYVPVDHEALIPLKWTREVAISISICVVFSVLLNLSAIWSIYNRRQLRSSSTAIIVANLACVDILVTFKDLPMFYRVSVMGEWVFEENWCASYGLTNVIFIIVSVSTLVTITTERFTRYRDLAYPNQNYHQATQRPVILGYVIAHTTLSYSLSLLWSKYIFVTRKAFCRVEWPPRNGFSVTILSSFLFIVPISFLIYNLLYKNMFTDDGSIEKLESPVSEEIASYEEKAQSQLHISVVIFLLSWTPYVFESLLSSYIQISPLVGAITGCIPLFTTSLLPFLYVHCFNAETTHPNTYKINVVAS